MSNKIPRIGNSVFVGFVTDGEGQRVKGASLMPWDKIEALYDHREASTNGKPVYQVRLNSGDVVKVIDKDDVWHAVA